MRPLIPAFCVVLTVLCAPVRQAAASESFPAAVQAKVPTLPCVPQCTLCHQANPGMPPANKPFAMKLKAASPIQPKNTDALLVALDKLKMAGATSDADGDTQGDYDELSRGEDPNSNVVGTALCVSSPLYGCGASTLARTPANQSIDSAATVASILSVFVGLLLLRRRQR